MAAAYAPPRSAVAASTFTSTEVARLRHRSLAAFGIAVLFLV
jgi:hypothetical protein